MLSQESTTSTSSSLSTVKADDSLSVCELKVTECNDSLAKHLNIAEEAKEVLFGLETKALGEMSLGIEVVGQEAFTKTTLDVVDQHKRINEVLEPKLKEHYTKTERNAKGLAKVKKRIASGGTATTASYRTATASNKKITPKKRSITASTTAASRRVTIGESGDLVAPKKSNKKTTGKTPQTRKKKRGKIDPEEDTKPSPKKRSRSTPVRPLDVDEMVYLPSDFDDDENCPPHYANEEESDDTSEPDYGYESGDKDF